MRRSIELRRPRFLVASFCCRRLIRIFTTRWICSHRDLKFVPHLGSISPAGLCVRLTAPVPSLFIT